MTYPLFDTGFTLWASDIDARLMDRFGLGARDLGIAPALLRDGYYRGLSAAAQYDLLRVRAEQDHKAA